MRLEKIYYLKENKYIRLKINRPTISFRASIVGMKKKIDIMK